MKIKILLIIGIFLPVIACAQEDYDFQVSKDNEMSRALATMESQAQYSSTINNGQYENSMINAEQSAGDTMENALSSAEENYQEAAQNDQIAQNIIQTADAAAQEAMTNALEQTSATAPQQDELRYTNLEQTPQPKVELPPQESKSRSTFIEKFKAMVGERAYGTFGVNTGVINGFSMYRISFDAPAAQGGHGESELLWPLRNSMIGLTGSLNYRTANSTDEDPRKMFGLDMSWHTRLSEDSGHMQDSDWIENDIGFIQTYITGGPAPLAFQHPGKDLYSESDTQVNQSDIVDVTGTYDLWLTRNIAVIPRAGYRYQKFAFSAYALNQLGYGPYGPGFYDQSYLDTQHLKWGDYAVKYRLPYFGLGTEMKWKKFSLMSHFDYSCWVNVRDTDRHLYPTDPAHVIKVSEGHNKGYAYLFGFDGSWQFWPDWKFNVGTSYVKIYAGGSTTQRWYQNGNLLAESDPITERIVNKYWLTNTSVEYVF